MESVILMVYHSLYIHLTMKVQNDLWDGYIEDLQQLGIITSIIRVVVSFLTGDLI